jgi:hypothetical protein
MERLLFQSSSFSHARSYSHIIEQNVGRVGYYGPVVDVPRYFDQHLGIPCPPEVNIADHIINETVAKKNNVLLGSE